AVPYVLLSFAALFPWVQRNVERRQRLLFLNMAVAVLALQAGRLVLEAGRLIRSPWAVTQVHNLSVLIANHAHKGPVATLYPTLALDAGSPIYPQFATAFFFFRAANHLGPERVLELNGVSWETLPAVLSAKPPAAVFIGTTSDFDRPLL